ncbi:transient receptor potential cation channel protein painless-like isoform X2 [Atheta coriaria]
MSNYHRANSILKDPEQQLCSYVRNNNVKEIAKLVENNKGLISLVYEDYGLTILELACCEYADDVNAETIRTLLKWGADPTRIIEEEGYKSALHLAALGQNPRILEVIVQCRNVDINSTAEGRSALQILITDAEPKPKMEECVEVLWRHGIDLHYPDEKNNTALYFAAKKKLTEIVKFILSKDNTVTSKEADVLRKLDPSLSFVIDDSPRNLDGLDYLKKKNESGFITWLAKHSDFDEDSMEKSFLQLACEQHLLQVVDFLIDRNPNKVGRVETHPLILAVENGYYQIVERLLNAPGIEIPRGVLNAALKRIDWDGDNKVNYQRTCEMILDSSRVDVNERDKLNGNYPLHYAVKYGGKKVVRELLRRKASLANRDKLNFLTITDIDHDVLKEHLDSCIEAHPGDPKDQNREGMFLTFDYTTLFPSEGYGFERPDSEMQILNAVVKESDVVLHMTKDRELKPLLQHPLIVSFLYVKWHQVRFLFLVNLITYLLFCASLLWFILNNYDNPDKVRIDFPYVLLFITTLLISVREVIQMLFMAKKYVRNTENWVEVGLLIDVYLMLFYPSTDKDRRPMFAIAILLAALELLFLLGSVPGLSTYIVMLRTVSFNFVKFLLFNAILIIAFAFSFYTLFRKVPDESENSTKSVILDKTESQTEVPEKKEDPAFFSNIYLALFKTLVMLTGEFEAGDLDFDQFPIASHLIFIMFVVLIAIILLNLLNGLAVSDTQEIKSEAKLVALTARAQYISYIESMIFGNVLPSTCARSAWSWTPRSKMMNCSRWWLTRVCIGPQLEGNRLKVFPNQEGRIEWRYKARKTCTALCGGDKIDESTIKLAKAIVAQREPMDENILCRKLNGMIQELAEILHRTRKQS